MPLRQYFSCVSGLLLAMLFILNAYFPKPPVVTKVQANLPVIRIHSDRKWPERVVYDTSHPTIVPTVEVIARAPETIVDVPADRRVQEAFAMLKMSADQSQGAKTKIRELKPVRQTKIARRRLPAPRVAMVRPPQFGWFGGNFW
jgi:hypothetical protein